jgi:hypothetical protein
MVIQMPAVDGDEPRPISVPITQHDYGFSEVFTDLFSEIEQIWPPAGEPVYSSEDKNLQTNPQACVLVRNEA